MKSIEITISANGQVKLETRGFSGASCRDASRLVEAALGRSAGETLTSEYHRNEVQAGLDQRTS